MWIEIKTQENFRDVRKEAVQKAIREDLHIKAEVIETSDIYLIDGNYSEKEAEKIANAMHDPITQKFIINGPIKSKGSWIAAITYKPQVTNPSEQSVLKLIADLGLAAESAVIVQKYAISNVAEGQTRNICEGLLANENTQIYSLGFESLDLNTMPRKKTENEEEKQAETVRITKAADNELKKVSKEGMLSLSLEEMKAIRAYFRKLGREPTDVELEAIAQTWSEHCKHKTFNSEIELEIFGSDGKKIRRELIGNLFKETIVAATSEIAKKSEWGKNLVSVFKDNAGIIAFDDENCIAFKVETHNHPSALDPYGGAGTGLGGVIRDVLGAGLGAKPIFNTDVFCFAHPDYDKKLPESVLHPKRILNGVVAGVRDYGNRMGIPTINGSVTFHDSYLAPLVYCGTAGIMPKWAAARKEPKHGDLIVVIGGRTGKDGLHGATFSSTELSEGTSTSVVQVGNAIEEKKMLDSILEARDGKLYNAITDCGAGGFSSAIGEMAKDTGAEVELGQVPLKQKGMRPWEVWLSESQERMVLAVPEKNLQKLKGICDREDSELSVIGKFTPSGKLVLKNKGQTVADLDMQFLHDGMPKQKRRAEYREEKEAQKGSRFDKADFNKSLKKLLGMPTIASKEWIVRQYDHEVQANTVIKPLTGANDDGPSDASVVRPLFGSRKGVMVSNGINPRYGVISSYWMAAAAIDEALRNIVATGGSASKTAILDNFCWADTNEPACLGTLVMAAKACKDVAIAYGTPFISGKDSLHNGGRKMPIIDTLLISAITVIDDVESTVTADIKKEGSSIYLVGETREEMGGSHYTEAMGIPPEEGDVPKVDAEKGKRVFRAIEEATRRKIIRACHDLSEGGLAVAMAEMCIAGRIGAELNTGNVPTYKALGAHAILFSESQSRFLMEVENRKEAEVESIMKKNDCPFGKLGKTKGNRLVILGKNGRLIDIGITELKEAWLGGAES